MNQNEKDIARVHRFHEKVGVSIEDSETVYLSTEQARQLGTALNSCAQSIKSEFFEASKFIEVNILERTGRKRDERDWIRSRHLKWRLKMYNDKLKGIIGLKITAIYKSGGDSDDGDFAFSFDDGSCIYGAPDGDCCSSSWVEHVSGVYEAIGKKIISFEERPEYPTHENADHSEHDCLSLYGITLVTEGGHRIDIDYRNSSNGYYSGWLDWKLQPDETPGSSWTKIYEDF